MQVLKVGPYANKKDDDEVDPEDQPIDLAPNFDDDDE